MAHFGRATQQFRQPLDTAKQYRVSAWLGFKTAWNDDTRKFEKQSPQEIIICRKLFEELGPRYQERPGGYIRILKCGYRTGDKAPMAFVELVDRPQPEVEAEEMVEESGED